MLAVLASQARDGPWLRGVVLQHPECPAHHRVTWGPAPRLGLMTGVPCPQAATSSRSSSRSRTASCPGSSFWPSIGRSGDAGTTTSRGGRTAVGGRSRCVVRTSRWRGRAGGRVSPAAHAEVHCLGEVLAVWCGAVLSRVDYHLGAVGHRRTGRTADDRQAARAERTGASSSGITQACPRSTDTSDRGADVVPHRPRWVHGTATNAPRPRMLKQRLLNTLHREGTQARTTMVSLTIPG